MALLLLFLLPLLAGVLIPLLPERPGLARGAALVAPVLQLITAAWLWRHPPGELVVDWLPRLGLVLELGLDGLSLPLVLLTALLTALAVLASPEELQNDPYGEGWLLLLQPADPSQLEGLMDAAVYGAKVQGA